MLISYNWLKEYVDIKIDAYDLAKRLTDAGVVVDNIYDQQAGFDFCVVGRLNEVVRHTNSDKLWLCQVDVGEETVQIVTGAQNVKQDQLVPVARVGANLPNGVKIKKSKLRGVDSFGMLISLEELGYDNKVMHQEEKEGIFILPNNIAQPGTPLSKVFDREDYLLELDLTPNRADCSSVVGLAYEVAALLGGEVKLPSYYVDKKDNNLAQELIKIAIEDSDLCCQYSARVIKDIKDGQSPFWMQNRLRHAGMRPISLIVDIANYVMIEHGQPLHTFDYHKIENQQIIVRRAKENEQITTLDEVQRKLNTNDLVIADDKQAVAIAGVMGGFNSEVTNETKTILLESACFTGPSIRRTSRSLGLASEASSRFSKGIEQSRVLHGLNRFAYLIEHLNAGTVVNGVVSDIKSVEQEVEILFNPQQASAVADANIPTEEMVAYFQKLGFSVKQQNSNLLVTIPTRRPDITTKIDLVEEVLRLRGYDKIGSTLPHIEESGKLPMPIKNRRLARTTLRGLGVSEVVALAFHGEEELNNLKLSKNDKLKSYIKISNPLSSNQSIMRTSMLPGLLQAAKYNLNRQQASVCISEIGRVFHKVEDRELPIENEMIGILAGGPIGEKEWHKKEVANYDFYSVKGIVECLFDAFKLTPKYERFTRPYLHPGRAAKISLGKNELGYLGELHPDVVEGLGIESDMKLIYAELNLHTINGFIKETIKYKQIAPYPAVERDMAIVLANSCEASTIIAIAKKAAGKLLENVNIFDIYQGKQIGEGNKSCAIKLRYRAKNRTLTTEEVNEAHTKVLKAMEEKLAAQLR
ncbi:phenylalanine--tRNA ligase subunit beta [Clostridium sp. 'deep sea']|uniref:phenylalanine--tRNA ligase subunit beta n=1 Tax=Clostridium sp. 'deep sea' TaxID=2779445 RepID=UPI001896780E|nr:phenylalanine--tRNA ligase subunit beta [Clostridium sp. 'deep sea']QOR35628.1 phenylalanine--tRNA ligase subunit beta [Clostridium sp. 'deep sea']